MRNFESFVFTHIPKCGGTSFRKYIVESALNSNIDSSKIHSPGFLKKPNNKNINQLNNLELNKLKNTDLKIIADHSYFNVHHNFKIKINKPFYYTILRDPIKRVISHYNFFYYQQGYGGCKNIHLNDLPDEKLNKIISDLSNIHINYIANRKKSEKQIDKAIYLRAVNNLEVHFGCFGILNQLEKSLELLNILKPSWLELDKEFPLENRTKNASKIELPNENILEIIKKHNQYDIKLFNFAERLFELLYHYKYKVKFDEVLQVS